MTTYRFFTQVYDNMPTPTKVGFDIAAMFGWISALSGILTGLFGVVAAAASCAWALIRLYETKTVQDWLARRRGE